MCIIKVNKVKTQEKLNFLGQYIAADTELYGYYGLYVFTWVLACISL